jgi:hypothetical protein
MYSELWELSSPCRYQNCDDALTEANSHLQYTLSLKITCGDGGRMASALLSVWTSAIGFPCLHQPAL